MAEDRGAASAAEAQAAPRWIPGMKLKWYEKVALVVVIVIIVWLSEDDA